MIVDTREVVGDLATIVDVLQQGLYRRLQVQKTVRLLVVGHEHVRVDLVYKHLIVEVGLDLRCLLDQLAKLLACILVVFLFLGVDHINQSAALGYVSLEVGGIIAWEVDNAENYVVVGVDLLRLNLDGVQQKTSLVRRQLLKHHFLY